MSDYITHTSLCEDSFRLILLLDDICEPFRTAVKEHQTFAYLGASTNGGDSFVHKLFHQYRESWNQGERDSKLTVKLAFCLAWVCHRATDRITKPVCRAAARLPHEAKLCKIYHDGFTFKEIYVEGDGASIPAAALEPNADSIPAAAQLRMPALQSFAWSLVKRVLMTNYTTAPDLASEEWWKNMERCQSHDQRLHIYEEAAWNPDPDYFRRFIVDSQFYHREDAVVRLASDLRAGRPVSSAEASAILAAGSSCHYGKALVLTMEYVRSASEFFMSEAMSLDELADRLDIGKPGIDGKGV